ncbi:MAG TPA: hypothetical protein VN622_00775 [Clostridia bacterium]|nr:hypothetical protein [Clostridia bacterium]
MSWLTRILKKFGKSSAPVPAPRQPEPPKTSTQKVPSARQVSKQVVIGLDFGTSGTKVVVRDLGPNIARPFLFEQKLTDGPAYILPSVVFVRNERLYFGHIPAGGGSPSSTFRSFKICLVCEAGKISCRGCENGNGILTRGIFRLPSEGAEVEVTATQLVAGFLAHAIGVVKRSLQEQFGPNTRIDSWINMGAPVDHEEDSSLRDEFIRALYIGERIRSSIHQGIGLREFLAIYQSAAQETVPPPEERTVFVHPETAVGLMSFIRSPQARDGLYALVDVGAGTTDISFCRITRPVVTDAGSWNSDISDVMAFYGASTTTIGSDEIDRTIAALLSEKTKTASSSALILKAKQLKETATPSATITCSCAGKQITIQPAELRKQVREPIDTMLSTYKKTNYKAFLKEPIQSRWRSYSIFLLGGGSRFNPVHEAFAKSRPSHVNESIGVERLSCPADLDCAKEVKAQFDIIAIAYGLSFPPLDFPRIFRPREVEPLRFQNQREQRPDRDELYPM